MLLLNAFALIAVLAGLGLLFGVLLAFLSKKIAIKSNPLIDEVDEELPKGQCGSCGFPGCRQYAEAVVNRPEVAANLCIPGGNEVANIIAKLTGKKAEEMCSMKAVLLCAGISDSKCTRKHHYDGMNDCDAANMLHQGDKTCQFSCLGYGNCQKVCPYNAIKMNSDQLPEINSDKCTGCGKCVEICPRNVLALVPSYAKSIIKCRNTDKGSITKKACSVGCIACGICERTCEHMAIEVINNIAVIDYNKCKDCKQPVCLVVRCVPKTIQAFYGVECPDIEPPKPRAPNKKGS